MSENNREESILRAQRQASRNRNGIRHRTLFGFLYGSLTHTPIYAHWRHLLAYLRRFRTFVFIARVLTGLLSALQTGALVILSTAILLVLLPMFLFATITVLLIARIRSRQANLRLRYEIGDRSVCVLFLSTSHNPFLAQNARSLAKDGCTVVVVSPYWISSKGLAKGEFYATFREEFPHVILARRYYFLHLRRHILINKQVAYLY